jgi:hypothetical protein
VARNPFRSEAAAFRFVGVAVVGALLIIGAAALNTWLGLAVAILVLAGVMWWYEHQPSPPPPPVELPETPHASHRILVVANETVGGGALREELVRRTSGRRAELLVVAPALNSRLRHWTSDEDGARDAADERVRNSVARLAGAGLDVRGEVGDGEPLQAIEDALRTFGADEIVISTHPEGRSNWLEQGLVDEARRRFSCPITHVVVDLEAEREEVQPERTG